MSSTIVVLVISSVLICFFATMPAESAGSSVDGAGGGILHIPSNASLANCPSSCGDVDITYPFGIGPGCFRQGFELVCDNDDHRHPKLFLGNTSNQIADLFYDYDYSYHVYISIGFNVTMRSGSTSANISWEPPTNGFTINEENALYIIGCGVETYLFDIDTNITVGSCTSVCVGDRADMEKELAHAGGYCNGLGCCYISLRRDGLRGLTLHLIHRDGITSQSDMPSTFKVLLAEDYDFSANDLYSSWVNTSSFRGRARLDIAIMDQSSCPIASVNNASYACGTNSLCRNASLSGYQCYCNDPVNAKGNPYVSDGCIEGYNPNPTINCKRSCGNMSIPYPFGIEEGCFAKEKFRLSCASNNFTILERVDTKYHVTMVSVNDGYLKVSNILNDTNPDGDGVLHSIDEMIQAATQEFDLQMKWSITNLTCQAAIQMNKTYACISAHSECLNVYSGNIFLGYRCKCSLGFDGNPYVRGADGCTDIDECLQPDRCNGICNNFLGGYNCTSCSHGKVFDQTKRRCITSTKQRNIILGTAIGISCGIGSIVLAFCATILANKWKKGIQQRIRRAYFKKNQGLLLEQLISDESATNKTKIFSLDELEEATNGFDTTRVLGRGGHGTVYKGILSDQRVVAIKKSKLVEQTEIDQFINEVAILSQIIHRNVVKLFGCCLESEVPLLVYEFISNGTLYELVVDSFVGRAFFKRRSRKKAPASPAPTSQPSQEG